MCVHVHYFITEENWTHTDNRRKIRYCSNNIPIIISSFSQNNKTNYYISLKKICRSIMQMVICVRAFDENRACVSIFDYFFKLSWLITSFADHIWTLSIIKHLMSYIIQVTEYKYSVPLLRNYLLSDEV